MRIDGSFPCTSMGTALPVSEHSLRLGSFRAIRYAKEGLLAGQRPMISAVKRVSVLVDRNDYKLSRVSSFVTSSLKTQRVHLRSCHKSSSCLSYISRTVDWKNGRSCNYRVQIHSSQNDDCEPEESSVDNDISLSSSLDASDVERATESFDNSSIKSEDGISSNKEAKIDLELPRRSMLVSFTCNRCGGQTERLVNPLAWEKGLVIVQCSQCKAWHKIADAAKLIDEIRFDRD